MATPSVSDLGAADLTTLLDATATALNTSRDVIESETTVALSPNDCLDGAAEQLKGKVVVITGARSGFGRAYSKKMAELGAKVVLSDLSLAPLEGLKKEIIASGGQATVIKCDTTSWEDQSALFEHAIKTYGVIDIVVPNAGVPEMGSWLLHKKDEQGKPQKPDLTTINVNLIGVIYTVHLAFYYLNENPSKGLKSIVILGSMSSFFGMPAAALYTLSKHAMLGLFRSVYHNGVVDGINVSIICPWFVATPILNVAVRVLIAGLPLATVEHVVNAMVYGSYKGSGSALCVDHKGVLMVPFKAIGGGAGGYYQTFSDRATGVLSTVRWIKDVIIALNRDSRLLPLLVALSVAVVGYLMFTN